MPEESKLRITERAHRPIGKGYENYIEIPFVCGMENLSDAHRIDLFMNWNHSLRSGYEYYFNSTSIGDIITNTKHVHQTNTINDKIKSVNPRMILRRQTSYSPSPPRHPPVLRNKLQNGVAELEPSRNQQLDRETHDSSMWKSKFLNC